MYFDESENEHKRKNFSSMCETNKISKLVGTLLSLTLYKRRQILQKKTAAADDVRLSENI